jgi:NDP-sugar pyrophosphorylase family protein
MDLGGAAVRFSAEDPILGTAGAWRKLAHEWSGTSLVVYGDNLTRFDLDDFRSAHARSGALATVALFDPARNPSTGIAGSHVLVERDTRSGRAGRRAEVPVARVTGFTETRGRAVGGEAGPVLVSTGACLLEPEVLARIGPGFADFGADVYPALVRAGILAAHLIEDGGFCLGLDTPEHFDIGTTMVETGVVELGAP